MEDDGDRAVLPLRGLETPFEAAGGTLTITPTKDGPFEVKGALTIVAASGRPAWRGTETWLCRCGQSKNKPFCDGAHRDAGFTSE